MVEGPRLGGPVLCPDCLGPGATFAEILQACRRKAGLSQQGLERAAGVSHGRVNFFERGRWHPRARTLARLAEVLARHGVRPRDLARLRKAWRKRPLAR